LRWFKSKRNHRCTNCRGQIKEGEEYLGNSYSAFCAECGQKRETDQLVYSRKSKNYTSIDNLTKCFSCDSPSIGHINGKPVCADHVGDAMGDMI
jgi:hypothetical protein